MEKKVVKNKAVRRSIKIICVIAVLLLGFKICDIIMNPKYYIFGHVTEIEVNAGWKEPIKTTDRHTIDVLLSCIRKARINNFTPAGVDGIGNRYRVTFTFADGGTAEYQYTHHASRVEPRPFKEFLDMISAQEQPPA